MRDKLHPANHAAYSRQVRQDCLQHAILQQLRAPSAVFRDFVRAHFKHKHYSLFVQLDE